MSFRAPGAYNTTTKQNFTIPHTFDVSHEFLHTEKRDDSSENPEPHVHVVSVPLFRMGVTVAVGMAVVAGCVRAQRVWYQVQKRVSEKSTSGKAEQHLEKIRRLVSKSQNEKNDKWTRMKCRKMRKDMNVTQTDATSRIRTKYSYKGQNNTFHVIAKSSKNVSRVWFQRMEHVTRTDSRASAFHH